jgi:AcrR family transcriptional regulator
MPNDSNMEPRIPLSRARVLRAAAALADSAGVESLTMRRLAQELGVEAMSLYNHVASKDDLLNGLVELVIEEIEIPPSESDWRATLRQRALSARSLMARHPWAPALIALPASRNRAMVRYLDGVVGCLRHAGFTPELMHHAVHLLDSRMFGFTQELFYEGEVAPEVTAIAQGHAFAEEYPNIAEVIGEMRHDDEVEFAFGLDLILDGLERLRAST